jgi:hypothetical protein
VCGVFQIGFFTPGRWILIEDFPAIVPMFHVSYSYGGGAPCALPLHLV